VRGNGAARPDSFGRDRRRLRARLPPAVNPAPWTRLALLASLAAATLGTGPVAAAGAATARGRAGGRRTEEPSEAVRELARWVGRNGEREELSEREAELLDARVDAVRALAADDRAHVPEAAGALLDLAALGLPRYPTRSSFVGHDLPYAARAVGLDAVRSLLRGSAGDAVFRWLTTDVLLAPDRHPLPRRRVALYLYDEERRDEQPLALLTVAADGDDPLRADVLELLPDWPGDAVDRFLVAHLDAPFEPERDPHPYNLLARRIGIEERPLGLGAQVALARRLSGHLLSPDWRDAARGLRLARALDPRRGAPLLIEALAVWNGRAEEGTGSRRIEADLVRELRHISGRSIGSKARNWSSWWLAVQQGRSELRVTDAAAAGGSAATFFGLRPVSDRVTFVIDHSGSMASGWGGRSTSRYVEAIEQMTRFLQASGEDTRFNVILFSGAPLLSSPQLVVATPEALETARRALLRRPPDGGTNLRPAIEVALALDREGRAVPERLEADTIVVLCDGRTAEGPDWVRPLFERVHAALPVVIHCAQIGTGGDGTLEELARLTGGEFVRVGG